MNQQEQINLINSLIIDNNIMAVTPAIARAVLIEMVMSQTPTPGGSGFSAHPPLIYDPFTNRLALQPIQNRKRRVKGKGFGKVSMDLEVTDVVEGWSNDGKSWWDSAVYNGGDQNNDNNYTVIVGGQIIA